MEIGIIEGTFFSGSFNMISVPVAWKLLIMWNMPGDPHSTKLQGDVQTYFLPFLPDFFFFLNPEFFTSPCCQVLFKVGISEKPVKYSVNTVAWELFLLCFPTA